MQYWNNVNEVKYMKTEKCVRNTRTSKPQTNSNLKREKERKVISLLSANNCSALAAFCLLTSRKPQDLRKTRTGHKKWFFTGAVVARRTETLNKHRNNNRPPQH